MEGNIDILKTRWILNYDTYTHHYRNTVSEKQCSHWDIDITEHATESSQKTKPFISVCLSISLSWIHILGIPGGKQNNSLCKEIEDNRKGRHQNREKSACGRCMPTICSFILCIYMCVKVHMCHGITYSSQRHPEGVGPLLPLCGSQGYNTDHQVWRQAALLAKPSCWSLNIFFSKTQETQITAWSWTPGITGPRGWGRRTVWPTQWDPISKAKQMKRTKVTHIHMAISFFSITQ